MTLAHIEALTNARCLETLWQTHTIKMETYGFDRLLYGHTNFRSNSSLGQVEDFLILTNHDIAYLDVFLGEGLFRNQPMLEWTLNHSGAQSWSIVKTRFANGELSPAEIHVTKINQSHDVSAGYTISFPSTSSRSKAALSLTAKRGLTQENVDEIWDEHGDTIELINNVAHLKIMSLPYKYPKRELTKRQREVLECAGNGKTVQDTADIIGRTPATVEKHLRLAREALNVDTTAQALLKAAFLDQIFLPKEEYDAH